MTVGLVQRAGTIGDETRFRLLETVRSVVTPGLPADVVPELRDRHARAIADLVAGQVARGAAAVADVVERLDAEADNIRLALDRLDETDPARGLELWDQLFYPFWAVRARLREGIARLERTASLVQEPTAALSRALVRYGMNQAWVGDETASRSAILRALEVARTVGDRQSEIESLVTLSAIAVNQGDVELAKTVDDGLRSIDDGDEPADVRMRLAEGRHHVAAAIHGQASDEARDALLEAAALAGETDQPRTGAALWGNLAIAYIHRREFAAAADASERAIALARRMQSPLLPWALGARAMALAESHSTGGALEALAEMIEETLARDMAVQTVDTLLAAMSVALAAGQPLTAARAWGAASAIEQSGAADIPPDDRLLAERTLARVRQRTREIDVELAIRDGEKVEPLAFLAGLPETLADRATATTAAASRLRHGDLTRREVEILRLLAAGRSDAEIAAELYISPKTASVHVSNVKAKLGVESRLEAALKAREMGFGGS
jgi:DNA-binding NarL/FixJ family response regulator